MLSVKFLKFEIYILEKEKETLGKIEGLRKRKKQFEE